MKRAKTVYACDGCGAETEHEDDMHDGGAGRQLCDDCAATDGCECCRDDAEDLSEQVSRLEQVVDNLQAHDEDRLAAMQTFGRHMDQLAAIAPHLREVVGARLVRDEEVPALPVALHVELVARVSIAKHIRTWRHPSMGVLDRDAAREWTKLLNDLADQVEAREV